MILVLPNDEMQAHIRKELREPDNPKDVEKDMEAIREWLMKQPHLPKDMDDQRLKSFLRGSKFSLEKAKKKIDMYYTMRAVAPEFYTNRDIAIPELDVVLDYLSIPPLPGLTPNGRRVSLIRGVDCEFEACHVNNAIKVALMVADVRLAEEKTGVAADVYILDASVATAAHFAKFSPTVIKKLLIAIQEAYPARVKEVHIINISPIIDAILTFVRPFIKEKMRKRIFFHSNIDGLYKYVPKEMLPIEYGGNAGTIDEIINEWRTTLREYSPWFKQQENIKTDESLRPGTPKTAKDLFGMEGTFRQLSID